MTPVPVGAGGTLHDYVPFYFAPRSPMLYTISRGNVPKCPDGQTAVVHLVSSVEKVTGGNLQFVFTDGHGIMALTSYYDDLTFLETLDWDLIKGSLLGGYSQGSGPKAPATSRVSRAEFLSVDFDR